MNLSLDYPKGTSTKPDLKLVQRETPGLARGTRVESLDYLRGTLALGVMFYHYKIWNGISGGYPLEQFCQRVGIYAVCTFYVLSGMSLGIVYARRQVDLAFLKEFAVKRFFRIAPLFWLVTTLTIIIRWILVPMFGLKSGGLPPHHTLLAALNYSLLFGWVRPDLYIAGGAWSIGNELVFYSLFPGLLVLMRLSRNWLVAAFTGLLVLSLVFPFSILNGNGDMSSEQWEFYVNPVNHAFLFAAGMALALLCNGRAKPSLKKLLAMAVLCIGIFVFWPLQGQGEMALVTGFHRLLFSGLSCAFCYLALVWHGGFGRFNSALAWIGNISYAVYLLHPILFSFFDIVNVKLLHANATLVSFGLALPATILAAMISWKVLEKPLMRLGRRMSQGMASVQTSSELRLEGRRA